MESMRHELEKEGFQICGGIGVSMKSNNDDENHCFCDLA
jgi:hypothetical protein